MQPAAIYHEAPNFHYRRSPYSNGEDRNGQTLLAKVYVAQSAEDLHNCQSKLPTKNPAFSCEESNCLFRATGSFMDEGGISFQAVPGCALPNPLDPSTAIVRFRDQIRIVPIAEAEKALRRMSKFLGLVPVCTIEKVGPSEAWKRIETAAVPSVEP